MRYPRQTGHLHWSFSTLLPQGKQAERWPHGMKTVLEGASRQITHLLLLLLSPLRVGE